VSPLVAGAFTHRATLGEMVEHDGVPFVSVKRGTVASS
jgi:hypothetical protein